MSSWVTTAIVVVVILALCFAGRSWMLWYWKVDETLKVLTDIRDQLKILRRVETESLRRTTPPPVSEPRSGPHGAR